MERRRRTASSSSRRRRERPARRDGTGIAEGGVGPGPQRLSGDLRALGPHRRESGQADALPARDDARRQRRASPTASRRSTCRWTRRIRRSQTATTRNYGLQVSGGTDAVRYFVERRAVQRARHVPDADLRAAVPARLACRRRCATSGCNPEALQRTNFRTEPQRRASARSSTCRSTPASRRATSARRTSTTTSPASAASDVPHAAARRRCNLDYTCVGPEGEDAQGLRALLAGADLPADDRQKASSASPAASTRSGGRSPGCRTAAPSASTTPA